MRHKVRERCRLRSFLFSIFSMFSVKCSTRPDNKFVNRSASKFAIALDLKVSKVFMSSFLFFLALMAASSVRCLLDFVRSPLSASSPLSDLRFTSNACCLTSYSLKLVMRSVSDTVKFAKAVTRSAA